jgi:hypothetical protein
VNWDTTTFEAVRASEHAERMFLRALAEEEA